MKSHLSLATWPKPARCRFPLQRIEAALLVQGPPLNLSGVDTRWTPMVKAARAKMAGEAKVWAENRRAPGPEPDL
jgi:hypothetical protein